LGRLRRPARGKPAHYSPVRFLAYLSGFILDFGKAT
jgi:hypothetical protein